MGWESLKKISILEEKRVQFKDGDDFEKVIPRPEPKSPAPKDQELNAMDEQVSTAASQFH